MGIELALDSGNADMCVQPRARGAQLRRSQPAFIIVMVMKLVSVSKSYAWRPLAMLPILKGSACTETDDEWVRHRRQQLYHRSMDHIIADINKLCSKDFYLRFADGLVRCSRAFYHVLVMDGQEVGAALMCDVNQCPVCTCPHSELDRSDVSFPYCDTESVKAAVQAAQQEHLDDNGEVKDGHNEEVRGHSCNIIYDIVYDIVCNIIYDINI